MAQREPVAGERDLHWQRSLDSLAGAGLADDFGAGEVACRGQRINAWLVACSFGFRTVR